MQQIKTQFIASYMFHFSLITAKSCFASWFPLFLTTSTEVVSNLVVLNVSSFNTVTDT